MGLMLDSLSFRFPVASLVELSLFNDVMVLKEHRSSHC